MNSANLIPIQRRRSRARARRLRGWIIFNALYAALLFVSSTMVYMLFSTDRSAAGELMRVNQEIDENSRLMLVARGQLAQAQETMTSVKAISEQPDWSALMAVVAESTSESVVLNHFDVTPVVEDVPAVQAVSVGKPVSAAQPAPRRVVLHLSGLGESQARVADFVLRLEKTNLFEHVNLLHTSRQTLMGQEAVGFELDCPLAGRIGGAS